MGVEQLEAARTPRTRALVFVDNRGVDGLVNGLAAVIGGGAAGSIADSIAGATIQAIYRERESGRLLDGRVARGSGTVRVRGVPGLNNDVVNVICTAAGAAVAMLAVGA